MQKKDILSTLKTLREQSPKRKFSQSIDFIIRLRALNLKKPEENVNAFYLLPKGLGKIKKICALVAPEMLTHAKETCDFAVSSEEFPAYTEKKKMRALARSYDFFIAQATIMPKIAQAFGKILGPKGKMPNPKAGCVIPPGTNLTPLVARLRNTVRLQTKAELAVKTFVGVETMSDEDLAENILGVYQYLLTQVPQDKNNIKQLFLKLTMGPAFHIKSEQGAEVTP